MNPFTSFGRIREDEIPNYPTEFPTNYPNEFPTNYPNENPPPNQPLPNQIPTGGSILMACKNSCYPQSGRIVNDQCQCGGTSVEENPTNVPDINCFWGEPYYANGRWNCPDNIAATNSPNKSNTTNNNDFDVLAYAKSNPLVIIGIAGLLVLILKK